MWGTSSRNRWSSGATLINTARHIGVLPVSNGALIRSSTNARAAASRCSWSSPSASITGSSTGTSGATTCTGPPSRSTIAVRNASCLATTAASAERSASIFRSPCRRRDSGTSEAGLSGAGRSRNRRVSCACESGAGPVSPRGVGPRLAAASTCSRSRARNCARRGEALGHAGHRRLPSGCGVSITWSSERTGRCTSMPRM